MAEAGPRWAFSALHRIFAPSSSGRSVSAIVLSVTFPPSNCCCTGANKEREREALALRHQHATHGIPGDAREAGDPKPAGTR